MLPPSAPDAPPRDEEDGEGIPGIEDSPPLEGKPPERPPPELPPPGELLDEPPDEPPLEPEDPPVEPDDPPLDELGELVEGIDEDEEEDC